jgi:ribosomal protein L11 methylase PrmA
LQSGPQHEHPVLFEDEAAADLQLQVVAPSFKQKHDSQQEHAFPPEDEEQTPLAQVSEDVHPQVLEDDFVQTPLSQHEHPHPDLEEALMLHPQSLPQLQTFPFLLHSHELVPQQGLVDILDLKKEKNK